MKKGFLILSIILFIVLAAYFLRNNRENITDFGKILGKNDSFDLYEIILKGADEKDIYGLFYLPLKEKFDVIIVLPAAAGTKESRGFYGEILADLGYGALILDQRGIGETGGYVASLEEDFDAFSKKKDVYQLLMAKDVISAVDFVKNIKGIKEVGVLGESMGGRNAMIAAGLDKRIKSAIIISSAGYSGNFENKQANDFISYINPNIAKDAEISSLAPLLFRGSHRKTRKNL